MATTKRTKRKKRKKRKKRTATFTTKGIPWPNEPHPARLIVVLK